MTTRPGAGLRRPYRRRPGPCSPLVSLISCAPASSAASIALGRQVSTETVTPASTSAPTTGRRALGLLLDRDRRGVGAPREHADVDDLRRRPRQLAVRARSAARRPRTCASRRPSRVPMLRMPITTGLARAQLERRVAEPAGLHCLVVKAGHRSAGTGSHPCDATVEQVELDGSSGPACSIIRFSGRRRRASVRGRAPTGRAGRARRPGPAASGRPRRRSGPSGWRAAQLLARCP